MVELKTFRTIALAEATSFLILLLASVVKHQFDLPLGVTILGPIHGALFLAYLITGLMVRDEAGWSIGTTLIVLFGAVVPFGGFLVDKKYIQPKTAVRI